MYTDIELAWACMYIQYRYFSATEGLAQPTNFKNESNETSKVNSYFLLVH